MKSTNDVRSIDGFLLLYFYQLEENLNNNNYDLNSIKFQSEESNTDEFLKVFFKKYIEKNKSIKNCDFSEVSFVINDFKKSFETKNLFRFIITEVFLPEDLTKKQKINISKNKSSVYTNPDLYLKIKNGDDTYYESVELKSTKNNHIPGSSIQQVLPFEWVIFIKRDKKPKVTTGYYINTITNKLPFPDRSPRPQIGFKNLEINNTQNRVILNNSLVLKSDNFNNIKKLELINDWQEFLTNEWMEIIKSDNPKRNEKWFNNSLRKFSVKLIDHIDNSSEEEKINLINKLKKLIK
ncbi:hypothetical protein N9P86_01605 [Flavobacteriaceae bacterium]|nr:hypothetical protein [Flavobacteriaceae bacterium]